MDLWIKGTDFINETLNSEIAVGNLTWNDADNYPTSNNLTKDFIMIDTAIPQQTNKTTFYWFDAPSAYAGLYKGNITIKGNRTE